MTKAKLNFVFGATGTTKIVKINENGYISDIVMDVPDFTNGPTAQLEIFDDEDYLLYDSTAKVHNAVYHMPTGFDTEKEDIPVDYGCYGRITLSGVAGVGGGTVKVRLFIKQNKQKGE